MWQFLKILSTFMRITGSYGPVRLGIPYGRVIRRMPVRNWTSCDVLVICKRVVYGFSTAGRGFYGFATMFWRRGRKNPYGYRTVIVRWSIRVDKQTVYFRVGPCGPVRYAVPSPTGHWNFGPYGARKLPWSSMWHRNYAVWALTAITGTRTCHVRWS